jgi:predicted DNA-binding protein
MIEKLVYFPSALADELALVARAEGLKVAKVVRVAVDKHLADRRADRGLPEAVHQPVFNRLVSCAFPGTVIAQLDRVATNDGVTTAAVVREAVRKHVADRKADGDFRQRLTTMLQQDLAVARRIGTPASARSVGDRRPRKSLKGKKVNTSTVFVAGSVAEEVRLQARADGVPISTVVREAAEKYAKRRKTDHECRRETQVLPDRDLLTVRFPSDLVNELTDLAHVDGITLASEIRAGINEHLGDLREDTDFQQRLQVLIERDQALAREMCGVSP